jgi:perosamine synthetase
MYKYPVYKPLIGKKEKEYVNECLDSTWISSKGKFISLFENKFSEYVKCDYSTTCTNGTVALHLALLALDIKKGDEVIVPTLTYIASVNAITYVGAKPIFIDSENEYWQINTKKIEEKITSNTKAIIVVHLYGHASNMDEIVKIAKKYNLKIIEDCAEAFGTQYKNKHVGSFGDIATYSFFGNKTITTGEGGMVTTNDKVLYKRIIKLKGQGLAENREYWHDLIGYNYRMTNIACAIGLAQIERVEYILNQKRRIAQYYKENLKSLPLQFHKESEDCIHSYWMCTILSENEIVRDKLRAYLKENLIETRPIFHPIHKMPMYNFNEEYIIAENISSRGINLPSYPELENHDLELICKTIKEFYVE